MQQPSGLLFNSLDNFGMAMAGGVDGNAGRKIKKQVAIDIMDPETVSFFGNEWIGPRVRRRNKSFVQFNQLLGPGPGQRCFNFRRFHAGSFLVFD